MGNTDSIPVCSGDAAAAKRTQENFSKGCPVISQLRSAVEATYDCAAAKETQEYFFHNSMEPMADGLPLIGHVKGAVHYSLGQKDKGDQCMKSASRTTAVLTAGAVTGGVAAIPGIGITIVAGCAAVAAGVTTDGITTAIDSKVHKQYRPSGIIAQAYRAIKTKKVGEWFDFGMIPVMDAIAGAEMANMVIKFKQNFANNSVEISKKLENNKNTAANIQETRDAGSPGVKQMDITGNIKSQVNSTAIKKSFKWMRDQIKEREDIPTENRQGCQGTCAGENGNVILEERDKILEGIQLGGEGACTKENGNTISGLNSPALIFLLKKMIDMQAEKDIPQEIRLGGEAYNLLQGLGDTDQQTYTVRITQDGVELYPTCEHRQSHNSETVNHSL